MTHRITKIGILLFLLFTLSREFAQTIDNIEIKGNSNFSAGQYSDWAGIGIGTKTFPGLTDTLLNRIQRNLADEGYFNSAINNFQLIFSEDSQTVRISFEVSEREPVLLNKIIPQNVEPEDSVLFISAFEWRLGEPLIKSEIEKTISGIIDVYENNGFPFSVVAIESIFFHFDSTGNRQLADIFLLLNKKEKSKIDIVEIIGNTSTNDAVIIRQIGLTKGAEYSQVKIDNIPKQLNRLKFFEPVQPPVYYFNSKNEGVLQITVKDKSTNNFDGILGFVPGTKENEKGYFTGYINISLRNLFGTGRAAAIRWQQETRHSQEFELRYFEPWIFEYPFNVSMELFQRKQDTIYVQRKLEGSIEFIATDDITASLILSTEATIPTESSTSRFTVFNSTTLSTGLNLKIDTRDDYYAPTEGILFLNTYKYSTKNISGPAEYIFPTTETSYNMQRLELDLSFFYEFARGQIAALSVHGREMRGSLFEISDLYLLGGAYTLRGYREKQFIGNRLFWSNLEYRYLLTRRTYAFLFWDSGYFLRNEDTNRGIEETSGFKIGYGAGINLETGLGILSVSYALGEGDSFSEGKIHFGILNEF
ncbi:outer membrane protein assembly factor [Bacteroidota bacterium]